VIVVLSVVVACIGVLVVLVAVVVVSTGVVIVSAGVVTGVETSGDAGDMYLPLFYRAMLCIRGTSHGPVSVRLSVTSRCSTKTATPHDSSGTLVF